MPNNSISFDSNDVSSVISSLNVSKNKLTDTVNILNTDFKPLIESNLFVDGLSKLSNKITSLESSFDGITSLISEQSTNYETIEDEVSRYADNYMSYYDASGSHGSKHKSKKKKSHDSEDIEVDDIDFSKILNTTSLDEAIKLLDDKTLIKCINFLNINKSDDIPFNVFLDEDNKDILATYLKEFYKDNTNKDLSITDTSSIRKVFIEKILNTDLKVPSSVKEDSIIKYKKQLTKIANKYNTDLNTLLTDVSYTNIVKDELDGLYKDKDSFKDFVNDKSKELNKSNDELLYNPELLI
jgi:hypothetical protein